MTFEVNGTTIGTATTATNGTVSLSYAIPPGTMAGAQPTLASFAGDSNDSTSMSAGTLTVLKGDTRFAPTGVVTGKQGARVTLIAHLVRSSDSANLAYETVTFTVDGQSVGTATTDSSGMASLPYTVSATVTPGNHPIGLSFAGDALYNPCAATRTLYVTK